MVIFKATSWLSPSSLCALVGVGAALLVGNHAAAEACDEHGGCPHGFSCVSSEQSACPAIDCASDAPDCKKAAECETRTVSECMPAMCATNDDCAKDMVCFEEHYKECDKPVARTCKEGEKCDAPSEEPNCVEHTRSSCTPRYVPPCKQDADCGPGFSCTELIEHSCSVSGGSASSGSRAGTAGGSADAGMPSGDQPEDAAPTPPPEPACTTKATGEFRCELQKIDCEEAKDCPDGFTCEELKTGVVCGGAGTASSRPGIAPQPQSGGAGGASSGSGGSSGGSDAGDNASDGADSSDGPAAPSDACKDQPTTEKLCLPPYAREQLARGDLHGDEVAFPARDAAAGTSANTKGGTEEAAQDPAAEDTTVQVCAVSAPGAGAGSLFGLFGALGIAAMVLVRRRS